MKMFMILHLLPDPSYTNTVKVNGLRINAIVLLRKHTMHQGGKMLQIIQHKTIQVLSEDIGMHVYHKMIVSGA